VSLEVLEVHLEIVIYLLDPIRKPFFSFLDLDISYLVPLIFEPIFQKFTWLNVELDDFFGTEIKFHIALLKFENFLNGVFFIFLLPLILLNTYNPLHSCNPTSALLIFFYKWV
jgi:hypothetical protein